MSAYKKVTQRRRIQFASRHSNRSGAALIEFAIVLPMLVTLALACIDFGRFAYTEINVTNAARVGAGYASVHPYSDSTRPLWQSNIRQVVINELKHIQDFDESRLQLPNATVTVDGDGQKRVRIEVTYPFNTLVTWPFLPSHVAIKRVTEMRFIR